MMHWIGWDIGINGYPSKTFPFVYLQPIMQEIKSYTLDNNYINIHKEGKPASTFGMDATNELLENGFGLYSSVNTKKEIGPLKSQFYRIGFCRKGSLQVACGLEKFAHHRNTIHFNFPGQLFSMQDVSEDMFAYYFLFTASFIESLAPSVSLQNQFPFLSFVGENFFELTEEEANKVEQIIFEMDKEIKLNGVDKAQAIKHWLLLLLINVKRSYVKQGLAIKYHNDKAPSLAIRFKKLVSQHFITKRNISEYAAMLAVTPKHLSKVVKEETLQTPSDFINEMVLMEIKAQLRYTTLTVAEIAYALDFSDPAHLSNFFKKHEGLTPQGYRNE